MRREREELSLKSKEQSRTLSINKIAGAVNFPGRQNYLVTQSNRSTSKLLGLLTCSSGAHASLGLDRP